LSPTRAIRIGTRGSRLALWQAHAVSDRLIAAGISTEIVVIRTSGDRSQHAPPAAPQPSDVHKREFVKELEEALLSNEIDVAVHSAKDLPVDLPEGLTLGACLPREDPLDALVLPETDITMPFADAMSRLGSACVVGTGSIRRSAQLAAVLPHATFAPIRGNVDTRLSKLDAGGFDALVLACAGLRRLGFENRITARIPVDQCVPAPGQGIVATEHRRHAEHDELARRALERLHDEAAGRALEAERAVVAALGGGCQLPLGALAVERGTEMEMQAIVAAPDRSRSVRGALSGSIAAPRELGTRLARQLVESGALEILEALKHG
jgi:hydroxymethylbilane synthase